MVRSMREVQTIPAHGEPLVKHTLAEQLRAEIVSGALSPGARIVEGTWGRKFGVAQVRSVRRSTCLHRKVSFPRLLGEARAW
jgi:hypothetical protein